MEQPSQEKKVIVVLVLVILALLAGLVWLLTSNNKEKIGFSLTDNSSEIKIEKTEKGVSEGLANFPSGLPLEDGDEILESYEATASDGRIQSTLVFKTELSSAAALRKFAGFFEDNGWALISDSNSVSPLALQKKRVMASIYSRLDAEDTIIEITLTQAGE